MLILFIFFLPVNTVMEATHEMVDHYTKRTRNHINLVIKCVNHLVSKNDNLQKLLRQVQAHDVSKWSYPEYIPYVFITWKYKVPEFEVPLDVANKMHEATLHHVKSNKHHPEFWDKDSTINKQDRDKPADPVDGTEMDLISIAEMVCDWKAVSLERNNKIVDWADSNVNIRWIFSDSQVSSIYRFIDDLEDFVN